MVIKPSIGRVVWYWPAPTVTGERPAQPRPALVCWVHHDREVNLAGFDHNGDHFKAVSVPLLQETEQPPVGEYAEWMPFQKEQVAKAAAQTLATGTGSTNAPTGATSDTAMGGELNTGEANTGAADAADGSTAAAPAAAQASAASPAVAEQPAEAQAS